MDKISLHPIDYIIILIYLILTLFIGLHYSGKKNQNNPENFLLAGRKLSLPAFTATLVSTWYGGILGIGEFTWLYGILNWVVQALPYYIFAIIFALFFAPKIQKTRLFTIPDLIYKEYGKKSGVIASILIFFLVTPAPHLLMVMFLLSGVLGIHLIVAYAISVVFSILYVYIGGFKAVVKTDILQFVLMFTGFIVLTYILITQYGGINFLQKNLPSTHLEFSGGMGIPYVLVWFFIALWTFVDPGFYQRCYAAKSPKTAKFGILAAVGFWLVFDLLTTTAGFYSKVLLPEINPVMAFPKLGELAMPPFFLGIFIVGLLATIMSTLDSTAFLSAVTFGRDIIWRIKGKDKIGKYTRIGLVVSVVFSTLLVIVLPSVVTMWYTLGSLLIPALLLPVLSTLFNQTKYFNDKQMFISMITGFLGALTWFVLGAGFGTWENPQYFMEIQPFYVGLLMNISILTIGVLKNKYTS